MSEFLEQCASALEPHIKNLLSKSVVTIGAPATGTGMGFIYAFFDKAIPVLTVISLITGIVLGILSYRLRVKESKRKNHDEAED